MSHRFSSREIQRWYPQKFSQVAGNAELIRTWFNFIDHGPCNLLITGHSRTGKSRTTQLGIKSVLCQQRQQHDPCGQCDSCRMFDEGRDSCLGLFAAVINSRFSYVPIDCETVSSEQLRTLSQDARLEASETIVYLDEVAALGRRNLEQLLLKMVDETPCIWIASAISVNKRPRKGQKQKLDGLSEPLLGRFALKVGTSRPPSEELNAWIRERCAEWSIQIVNPDVVVPRIAQRTEHRVGYVINMLAVAASRGRVIDLDFVDRFHLEAVD